MVDHPVLTRLFGVLLVCVPLLTAQPAAAIVGQAAREADDASHVVMVLSRDGTMAGFCTGIVLARDIVLTAAHCAAKGADLRVHYPAEGQAPVMLPIVAVSRHPDYHPDAIKTRERSIDLALIKLPKPLPDRFRPAILAHAAGSKLGGHFVLSGYGLAREGDAASSGTLRSATLTTRAPLSPVLLWSEDAAREGLGACTGDSGGPVVAEGSDEISAVILWTAGQKGQQCGDLTQSVWLAPQRPWIDRVLQAWGVAPIP